VLGAGFKPVGELHSQPFDSAFVADVAEMDIVFDDFWRLHPLGVVTARSQSHLFFTQDLFFDSFVQRAVKVVMDAQLHDKWRGDAAALICANATHYHQQVHDLAHGPGAKLLRVVFAFEDDTKALRRVRSNVVSIKALSLSHGERVRQLSDSCDPRIQFVCWATIESAQERVMDNFTFVVDTVSRNQLTVLDGGNVMPTAARIVNTDDTGGAPMSPEALAFIKSVGHTIPNGKGKHDLALLSAHTIHAAAKLTAQVGEMEQRLDRIMTEIVPLHAAPSNQILLQIARALERLEVRMSSLEERHIAMAEIVQSSRSSEAAHQKQRISVVSQSTQTDAAEQYDRFSPEQGGNRRRALSMHSTRSVGVVVRPSAAWQHRDEPYSLDDAITARLPPPSTSPPPAATPPQPHANRDAMLVPPATTRNRTFSTVLRGSVTSRPNSANDVPV